MNPFFSFCFLCYSFGVSNTSECFIWEKILKSTFYRKWKYLEIKYKQKMYRQHIYYYFNFKNKKLFTELEANFGEIAKQSIRYHIARQIVVFFYSFCYESLYVCFICKRLLPNQRNLIEFSEAHKSFECNT